MFESSHRSTGGSSANRWLIVAGAGLVILAFVARMLLDIGHAKVSDLTGVLKPDTTSAQAAPAVVPDVPPDSSPAVVVDTPSTPAPVAAPAPAPPTVPAPPTATSAAPSKPIRVANVTPPILKTDTTAPRPATPRTPAPAPSAGGYAVQIGAFGSEANANKLRDRASALGYGASVIPQRRGASELYLVRVQGLTSAESARQASDSLARTLGVKSVVVPPGR